jgi:hypothetical protein
LTNPDIEFSDTEGLTVQFLLRSCNSCHTPHTNNSVRSSHLFLLLQPTTITENRKFILSEILPIPISTKNRIYLSEIDPNIFYKTEFFFGIDPKSPSFSPLKEKERVYL